MNYIQKLQNENRAMTENRVAIQREINSLLVFLQSDKFTGTQSDGSRKDWIATGDVISRLHELRAMAQPEIFA